MATKTQQMIQQLLKRDMTIGDVLEEYPDAAPLLTEKGIHCVGCHVSPFETLEEGFRSHGMTEEQIDTILADVNEKLDTVLKNQPENRNT
jgi:hybrid cluster-associated redox disulfide protein